MRFSSLPSALLALPTLLLACASDATSSSAGAFSADPLVSVNSDSGNLKIDVRTSPAQPPSRGEQTVQLTVTDVTTGEPKSGLTVAMTPWMPAMGHGASVTPSVTEKSPGIYVVSNVDLFMPGNWELRTTFAPTSNSSDTDHAAPAFQIP